MKTRTEKETCFNFSVGKEELDASVLFCQELWTSESLALAVFKSRENHCGKNLYRTRESIEQNEMAHDGSFVSLADDGILTRVHWGLERERLQATIWQWNSERLDLFEISEPDEVK